MKSLSILAAGLLVALSFGAQAAEGNEAPEAKAPAGESQVPKAPAKKAKRHSHVEEKTGMAQPEEAPGSSPAKIKADKDRTKHFHPRDAK